MKASSVLFPSNFQKNAHQTHTKKICLRWVKRETSVLRREVTGSSRHLDELSMWAPFKTIPEDAQASRCLRVVD